MPSNQSGSMRSATRTLILTGMVCVSGTLALVTLSVRDMMRSNGAGGKIIECVVDGTGAITGPKRCSDTIVIVPGR